LVAPSTEFPDEVSSGGGVTAFIGATIFEFGSVLLMLEAINENRAGCFGWAVELLFDDTQPSQHKGAKMRVIPAHGACTHHHLNRGNLVGKSAPRESAAGEGEGEGDDGYANSEGRSRDWLWFPSVHDLRTHYLREIGFLACSAQMFGATIFWISGFTALPGIYNHLSPRLVTGVYWVPQIIGGSGFIASGTLFMIETQERWWKPAPATLGWHVGFWNLVGGLGFTLCPAFGLDAASWAQLQASTSTFWASWAFLIASLFQLYESLQKHPVEVVKRKDADKKKEKKEKANGGV
jgi:hypothetical protein